MSTESGSLLRGWQLQGETPAIQPALALYHELWAEGYTLTLITGRSASSNFCGCSWPESCMDRSPGVD